MKIKNVTLKGFKKYDDKTYNLTGLDLLIGKNGKGKSSVIDGIKYNILGYIPGFSKKNEDIFKYSNNGKSMSSKLVFDDDFIAERSLVDKKEDVEILPFDKEVRTLAEKNKKILSVTKVDPITLNFSEYLSFTPSQKKQYFQDLMGTEWGKDKIHKFIKMKIKETTKTLDNVIEETLHQYKDSYSTEQGLEAMLQYLTYEKKRLNAEIQDQDGAVKQLSELRNSMKETDRELEKNNEKQIQLNSQLIDVEKKLSVLKEKKEQFNNLVKKILNIENQIESYKIKKSSINKSIEEIGTVNIDNIENQLNNINSSIKQLDAEIKGYDQQLKGIEIDGTAFKVEIETKTDFINKLRNAHGSCPLDKKIKCNFDFNKLIEETSKEIIISKNLKAKLGNDFLAIKSKRTLQVNKKNDLANKKESLTNSLLSNNKNTQLKSELSKTDSNIQLLDKQKKDLEIEKADINLMNNEILTKQRDSINFELSRIKDLIAEATKAKTTIALLEKTALNREDNLLKIEAVKKLQTILGPKGLQNIIVTEGLTPLEKQINEYLDKIKFDGKIFFKSEGKNFDFGATRDCKNVSFDTLSNGEKTLFTLAIIAAIISKKGSPLKLLLIDDINNLDIDNRKSLLEGIVKFKSEFDNIIVAGAIDYKEVENLKGFNVFNLDEKEKEEAMQLGFITEEII